MPSGSLTGATNYVSGQQHFTIEAQLKDEEAEKRVLEEIKEGHELYLIPPHLVRRDETPEGGPRLRLLWRASSPRPPGSSKRTSSSA